jgi:protein-S-isoprenylcysteine O-methyltransferase Ste14
MGIGPWVVLFSMLAWGLVHSLFASLSAKARARQWFGSTADRWYRLGYNTFSILTFLPILALTAAIPSARLYIIPTPWSYLTLVGQLLALLALAIGLMQTGIWSFLGFEQMLKPDSDSPAQMATSGIYRWVRHPLYTAGLVFIWLTPIMSGNLLALNVGLTLYLILGAMYEERKLVRQFGAEYTHYQESVPMLIPGLGRKRPGQGDN